jgi:hypothetical protein
MEAQDFRSLQEAYMEVYQELDEAERPLPYGRMMKKSDELADSDDKKKRNRAAKIYLAANAPKGPKVKVRKEQVDIYDIILSHLLDEGYAETPEAAERIMVHMSEEWRESIMIDEGLDMKTFKANRKKARASAARADAVKRGHVGKEWYNSGRRYSPDEAKRMRSNLDDEERRTRHRSAVDPDNENDDNFSADKTKNPKKLRKQKAMGEH